ncbi:MAG: 3-hydroxyacyl-CoA dehydrogenase family protein [Candidatus Caldarchaeum sp.]
MFIKDKVYISLKDRVNRNPMSKTAIIGSGLMGSGIAVAYSLAGYRVSLVDVNEEILKKSVMNIKNILQELFRIGVLKDENSDELITRISTTISLQHAVKGAEIVTEAVSESLELKIDLFGRLDTLCEKDVILASNTSSFRISDIAQKVRNKERVVGTHWWNPPYLMPLVEIIRTDFNQQDVIKKVVELFTRVLKKEVIMCKDSPGGVGVRLQAALFAEAMRICDENIVSPSDIDKAIKLTLGLRYALLGPFQIADLGGLDVFLHAHDYLAKMLGERFTPSKTLLELVEKGYLGAKSGKGFYSYSADFLSKIVKRRNEAILEILKIQQQGKD